MQFSTALDRIDQIDQIDVATVVATSDAARTWLLTSGLRIVVIALVAVVVRFVLQRTITRVVRRTVDSSVHHRLGETRAARLLANASGALHERRRQRVETLGSVLRSLVTAVVYGIATLMILAEFGADLGPLLASAGVAGVALGFGAQSLVKDYLSGVFMLLEDQYGVGDVVDTGEAVGTVEEVTLRVTRLRDADGVVWYVRNGEILRLANKSQGWSTGIVDLPVAYSEDVERVQQIIRGVTDALYQDPKWAEVLLEAPVVAGVETISGTSVTIRVFAKTAPMEQYGVQREIRERVKRAFDLEGVRAPSVYPPLPGVPGTPGAPGGTTPGTV